MTEGFPLFFSFSFTVQTIKWLSLTVAANSVINQSNHQEKTSDLSKEREKGHKPNNALTNQN